MKIVTWNCAGALRRKRAALEALSADVLIVQECESPAGSADRSYRDWAERHAVLWVGQSRHKGLGVFVRPGLRLESVALDDGGLMHFLPCRVEGIPLLAVWTKDAPSSDRHGYIGQLWHWLRRHPDFLRETRALLAGDFNSNAIWDRQYPGCSHSDVVRLLESLGLHSLYHRTREELQGQERTPTFFLQRNPAKPYHIDYAFLSACLLEGARIEIGTPADWLALSDHMPLVVDLANSG